MDQELTLIWICGDGGEMEGHCCLLCGVQPAFRIASKLLQVQATPLPRRRPQSTQMFTLVMFSASSVNH